MDGQVCFSNMSNLSAETPVPHGTIHEAFESIVDTHAGIMAAVHGQRKITYHQLDLASNRLAHYLISSGLRPRERVCLVVQRSLEMLIGLMAILKADCQYVPIDDGVASNEALRHIFEDAEARFILCLPSFWDRVKRFAGFYPPTRPNIKVSSKDRVYAMYTSGTGVPKGVDVKHGTMANAPLQEPGRLRMTVCSKVAQVLSVSFAMGAWKMLGPLINGATLYLRGSDWNATLEQVDTLIYTPSIIVIYTQRNFTNIRTVAVAGEACPQALADDWAQGRRFHNLLGATETFLFSAHTHNPGEPLSIGRPLPNTTCYILDEIGEPVPTGQKGTLWVGGAGVAKGYINLPLTTNEKFEPDRFANDGSVMYNFGNFVCWRADGSLDSFGRMDDQVKIKGFRVELDGVTAVLEVSKTSQRRCLLDASQDVDFRKGPEIPSWPALQDIDLEQGSEKSSRVASQDVDHEKGFEIPSLPFEASSRNTEELGRSSSLPEVKGPPVLAWLRHRVFIVYRWLLFSIVYANIGVACWLLHRDIRHNKYPLSSAATVTAANLCAAILIRSEPIINLLFTILSSLSTSAPLGIRRMCANVYHIGGIHVGCAVSAVIWFIIFTVDARLELAKDADVRAVSLASVILSYILPYHDVWESLHRFGGWTILILYWVRVGISTKDLSRVSKLWTTKAFLWNPSAWLVAVATIAIVSPWLFLRHVPVRSEVLSSHAVRLHFDDSATPGKGVRLAQHPLGVWRWHGFATFIDTDSNNPSRQDKGYSVIVSRAGDFTGRIIDTAPTHIWRRGIPTCGFLRIATLFKSVVVVATGSGIGPCLSIFPYEQIAMRILWTAPNHEKTFGWPTVEEVYRRDPNAVIYNTRESGKPDMNLSTYRLYKENGAEAVLVISNKRFTTEIVYDLRCKGIPAYGALFDS
ncbi:acetyl-CoA synthetase-like protein [Setomelanomma holmii]|uniref:Acetyl-CoA synthetase-like protein n=1 Tax=Setomelanomma holmii TaxID=210430 RepID=A0A9P4GXT9_9PLEO|nr:acetyl-CoA synthetase-like protein [Setomelanomma holmii]